MTTTNIIRKIEKINYSDYRVYKYVVDLLESGSVEELGFRNLLEELVETYKELMKEFFRKDNKSFYVCHQYDGTPEPYFDRWEKFFSPTNLKRFMVLDKSHAHRYDAEYTRYVGGICVMTITIDGWGDHEITFHNRCERFDPIIKRLEDIYQSIYYYEREKEDND